MTMTTKDDAGFARALRTLGQIEKMLIVNIALTAFGLGVLVGRLWH